MDLDLESAASFKNPDRLNIRKSKSTPISHID